MYVCGMWKGGRKEKTEVSQSISLQREQDTAQSHKTPVHLLNVGLYRVFKRQRCRQRQYEALTGATGSSR